MNLYANFYLNIKIDIFKYIIIHLNNNIKMDFTNMFIKDFIAYIITFDNIMDILDSCKTPQDKVAYLITDSSRGEREYFLKIETAKK